MKPQNSNENSFFFLKYFLGEIGIILLGMGVFWLLGRGALERCLHESVFIMSLASMCHLGIEVFDALVKSDWRHKIANYRYYPIYYAFILIVINAIICPLSLPFVRWYGVYIFPVVVWIIQIVLSTWEKWTKS